LLHFDPDMTAEGFVLEPTSAERASTGEDVAGG
jgi:hypothetical protein